MNDKHLTHSEKLLSDKEAGRDNVKSKRFFSGPFQARRASNPALPTFAGYLPFFGLHKRARQSSIPGDMRRSPAQERR